MSTTFFMKEIDKVLHSLSDEKLKDLSVKLILNSKSKSAIFSKLTSLTGFNSILTKLREDELKIIKIVYSSKGGITLGEIEKETQLEVTEISQFVDNLSRYLLLYVLKNRQLINIKMDKVYGFQEIAELINITTEESIKEYLGETINNFGKTLQGEVKKSIPSDQKSQALLTYMVKSGCIITLKSTKKAQVEKNLDKIIEKLIEKKIIHIFYVFEPTFQIYLLLDKIVAPIIGQELSSTKENKPTVNNRFLFLNNLLNAFDTISTYGLFLTKQLEFRKIDIRRIEESLLDIYDIKGEIVNKPLESKLILFILNTLKCLHLQKDIAYISLNDISKDLENPVRLLNRIVKTFKE